MTLNQRREHADAEWQAARVELAEAEAAVRAAKDRLKAARKRVTLAIAEHGRAWGGVNE